ncbi:UvrD-helicase domain-containing protein [Mesoterricola sediminis]|uniref:DNA 3'-5' helicase n=1 Tax=Mesoterricola sediminis TaxID=2927980 RepID=A0AA48H0X6_9BACT|nr:UvrD-helicase domain-containing protein [Mesoterricola sediminis]BDU77597.1 hypothetical protein METESE_25550 [Mesoterricola sediminis]
MNLRHPRPAVLQGLGDSHCVIEASAGTGKTFTIEHLVVDLVLKGIPLERILVVTFTVKATLELKHRLRAKLQELARLETDDPGPEGSFWTLGPAEREALAAAVHAFDRASVSTIHGFCQQALQDGAFEGGRLFTQEQVSAEAAFDAAFKGLLRTRFATADPRFLEAALDAFGDAGELGDFLRKALEEREALDLGALEDPAAAVAAIPRDTVRELLADIAAYQADTGKKRTGGPLLEALREAGLKAASINALRDRLLALEAALDAERVRESPACLWAEFAAEKAVYVRGLPLREAGLGALAEALEPLAFDFKAVVAAKYLPVLAEELAALKRDKGWFDFGDMIALVHEAVTSPAGAPTVARLRERYQVALIDEFQDTDHRQWDIFRTLFLDSPDHRLILVGDPKQAIYGFRSGDLPTYLRAVDEVRARTGRDPLVLDTNFRSTPEVIEAYCAIFRPGGTAFFTGSNGRLGDGRVACGKPGLAFTGDGGAGLPAVRVLEVRAGAAEAARSALAPALAQAVKDLLKEPRPRFGTGEKAAPLRPEDIMVLTRTASEGQEAAAALRAAGVPFAFFKQEGLFGTPEAAAVRDLLLAVEAPHAEGPRAKALLGPFFGLTLAEAEACRELPESHPILRRLYAWQDLARARRYGELFGRVVSESGVTRRLLFLEEGERALTNVHHLLELLLAEALRRHATLLDLATALQRWIDGIDRPAVEDGDVQRLERASGAVQILTMHKSKGLEAPVVAVYGGISPGGSKALIHRYHDAGQARRAWVGKLGLAPEAIQEAVRSEAAEEWERLLYVALTRAKAQLILPRFLPPPGKVTAAASIGQDGDPKGPYGCVNRRLRDLLGEGGDTGRFRAAAAPAPEPPPPPARERLATWEPAPGPRPTLPDFAALARRGRPLWSFSYTSLEHGLRGLRPPEDAAERTEAAYVAGEGPAGGARLGTQVHALLEAAPLDLLRGRGPEAWRDEPALKALLEPFAREDREAVAAWAHAALAGELPLPGGGAAVLAEAPRVLRELDFLAPYPRGGDLLTGSMDVLFEWEGRAYLADWKTNRLAAYGPEALDAKVRELYLLQLKAYTLTARAFLGLDGPEAWEAGFGGFLFVFLRGLPGEGVWSVRPAWKDLLAWEAELAALPVETLVPASAGGGRHG